MRSRDEVLTVEAINDRLRELESQQAASEPVAWVRKKVYADGSHELLVCSSDANGAFPLYAHPSAAAVRVTDAMVRTAFVRLYPGCEPDEMQHYHAADIRAALTAALTHATTPTRGSDA